MDTINDRLVKLRDRNFKNNTDGMAAIMDVAPETLSRYLAGKRTPQGDSLIALLDKIPELSAEWLMRGDGLMFSIENQPTISQTNVNGDNIGTVISDESEVSSKSNTAS